MRIEQQPILKFDHEDPVEIYFEGKCINAYTNETIAAALVAAGYTEFGHSSHLHRPRGLFCGIGNCASCAMRVDGIDNVRVCVTKCRQGMQIERQ